MAGKLKMTFFQYRFMSLIFIYFAKRGEGSYWREALDGMNKIFYFISISSITIIIIIIFIIILMMGFFQLFADK